MTTAKNVTRLFIITMSMGFVALVLWPLFKFSAEDAHPASVFTLALLFRLSLFFIFFHLLGYWYFRYLSLVRPRMVMTRQNRASSPHVAIIVPIRDEPVHLVDRMMRQIARITYAPFTVVFVDNSTISQTSEIQRLAHERNINIEVIRKRTDSGFKAGALNSGLKRLNSSIQYVLVLDIDHAPRPDALDLMVPILDSDPTVAFLQAPQRYEGKPRSIIEAAYCFKQRIFYDHICPGLSAAGCAFMSGTNVLIRLSALREVDGFDESSLTEDLRTSLRLHFLGWKSQYFPLSIGYGYPPRSLYAYHRQLRRWAIGTIQNCLNALRLLIASPKSLSIEQWLTYLGWNGLFYVQGPVGCGLIALSAYLLHQEAITFFTCTDSVLLAGFIATLVSTAIHERVVAKTPLHRIIASKVIYYGDLVIMAKALWDLITRHKLVFDVTPKSEHKTTQLAKGFCLSQAAISISILVVITNFDFSFVWGWQRVVWPMIFMTQSATLVILALEDSIARGNDALW